MDSENYGSLLLSAEELNLVRQWFNAADDCAPKYLEPADRALMDKIMKALGEAPHLAERRSRLARRAADG